MKHDNTLNTQYFHTHNDKNTTQLLNFNYNENSININIKIKTKKIKFRTIAVSQWCKNNTADRKTQFGDAFIWSRSIQLYLVCISVQHLGCSHLHLLICQMLRSRSVYTCVWRIQCCDSPVRHTHQQQHKRDDGIEQCWHHVTQRPENTHTFFSLLKSNFYRQKTVLLRISSNINMIMWLMWSVLDSALHSWLLMRIFHLCMRSMSAVLIVCVFLSKFWI